jgi:hypothetical protein
MSDTNQRDMSHIKRPWVTWASVALLLLIIALTVYLVYLAMIFMHASAPVASRFAMLIGIPGGWFIYFRFLLGILWVKVDGDEEVILQDTLNLTTGDLEGQTDNLHIPKGMRSLGGPGYRAKSPFEEIKIRLPVKKEEEGGDVKCNDKSSDTYELSYSFTYSRIRGRYSVIGAFYDEDEAVRTLKAIVESTIEGEFMKAKDGRDIRSNLQGFNENLSGIMGGDRKIDDSEIRCGLYITGIIITKIDEDDATRKKNQAASLTKTVQEALDGLSKGSVLEGVNPNLRLATIHGVEVKIIDGLPPGATGNINV